MIPKGDLLKVCRKAFDSVILDPSVKIKRILLKKGTARECHHGLSQKSLIVKVFTNDASMLRGAPEAYKGSYKERVEGILDYFVKEADASAHAHLEIVGPETSSVERLVLLSSLVNSGKVSPSSPYVTVGREHGIDYAVIRGRHMIGPCPALAVAVRALLRTNDVKVALDLFAGTGIVTKTVCAHVRPDRITVVEKDETKVARMKSHMVNLPVEFSVQDAFKFKIDSNYDLVVADPYFEDALLFLDQRLADIMKHAKIFVLVSGNHEDEGWNKKIRRRLEGAKLSVKRHCRFGEVVYVCRIPSRS